MLIKHDSFSFVGKKYKYEMHIFEIHNSKFLLQYSSIHVVQGEEYKLFWPEQTEFVRAAARFGAKIIPFGVIGEDDIGQVSSIIIMPFALAFSINY